MRRVPLTCYSYPHSCFDYQALAGGCRETAARRGAPRRPVPDAVRHLLQVLNQEAICFTCYSYPADMPPAARIKVRAGGAARPAGKPYSCYSYPIMCVSYPVRTVERSKPGCRAAGLRRMPAATCFRY